MCQSQLFLCEAEHFDLILTGQLYQPITAISFRTCEKTTIKLTYCCQLFAV